MNVQFPFPSFDDIRKILHFWIDQQDKWFYFETGMISIGKSGQVSNDPKIIPEIYRTQSWINEKIQYSQSRIVGRIHDVVPFPPSLLLQDVTIFTVILDSDNRAGNIENVERRKQYGLVFTEITYYEPVENIDFFMSNDTRIQK